MRHVVATVGILVTLAATLTACGGVSAPVVTTGAGACGPVTAVASEEVVAVAPAPTPALPVAVASADGTTVTVTDASRILPVNLYGSIAEIVFSLGLGDRVVGRDSATTFAAAAHLPVVTPAGHDLSAEAILALDPTVVLLDGTIGPAEVVRQIKASGIPVVHIDDEQSLASVPRHIRAIAAALGVPAAGEEIVARVEGEIAAARRSAPPGNPPRVAFLYVRGTAGVYLIGGKGAGSDEMIQAIGAIDVGTELGLENFRPLTSEALVSAAPDVLLVMSSGLASVGGIDGLLGLAGVAQTPAGQSRRIIDVDDGLLLNFGARTGRVIAALADAVYGSCEP